MRLLPPDLHVLVRGWLDGNVVLVHGSPPVLVDTGYHTGATALQAWLAEAGVRPGDLGAIALTHVHSDHAGGVAALQGAAGGRLPVYAHADARALLDPWDPLLLWLTGTGQEMPVFAATHDLEPGRTVRIGDGDWRVLPTPGHAVGGVAFLREHDGVLISGDALWEDGFGMLNTWLHGPGVFEEAARALDTIEDAAPRLVIPGHGAPFTDVSEALANARGRLAALRADPERNLRQVLRAGHAFTRLAHPDWGPARRLQGAEDLARTWGFDPEVARAAFAAHSG
jgi:glyoxylase-like metal-dependent hydrolase (beta-lactamase superfamily II)